MQFKFMGFQFSPSLLGTAVTLIVMVTCIRLGIWQLNKAYIQADITRQFQASKARDLVDIRQHLHDAESLRYQSVAVAGYYDTKYQILIDNQVENSLAGFHVLTPFKVSGTNQYVLVNRGWIKGFDQHDRIPTIHTPQRMQQIKGMVWLPSKKIFTLEPTQADINKSKTWSVVWQNLDFERYQRLTSLPLLPVIIKLDPSVGEGGYVRNWQLPPSKMATNLGYAYQWFGFAFAACMLFIYTHTKRVTT
jgi:surfeit locus 1 family protein